MAGDIPELPGIVFLACACFIICDTMLWMSDIFACTVKLSSVIMGNGTACSGCCGVPVAGFLLIVSDRAAIGRVKKSGFVEYALHNITMMKSFPIVNGLLFVIICCKNLKRNAIE